MSIALAAVLSVGGPPAHLVPVGQVTVLLPVASCLMYSVQEQALPLVDPLMVMAVTLLVSVRLKTLAADKSNVSEPPAVALVVINSRPPPTDRAMYGTVGTVAVPPKSPLSWTSPGLEMVALPAGGENDICYSFLS